MDDREILKRLENLRDICGAKSDMAVGDGKIVWAGYADAVSEALDRLKAQEPPTDKDILAHYHTIYKCPGCGTEYWIEVQRYCQMCGRVVRWNAAEGN